MPPRRVSTRLVLEQLGRLGYAYHGETKRVHFYRRANQDPIPVTKSATMFEDTARSILRQCGLEESEISAALAKPDEPKGRR